MIVGVGFYIIGELGQTIIIKGVDMWQKARIIDPDGDLEPRWMVGETTWVQVGPPGLVIDGFLYWSKRPYRPRPACKTNMVNQAGTIFLDQENCELLGEFAEEMHLVDMELVEALAKIIGG